MLKHSFHSAVRAASSGRSRERRGSCTRSVKAALAGLPSQRRTAVLDGQREKSGSQDESGRALAGEVLVRFRDVAAVGCILSASIDIWGAMLYCQELLQGTEKLEGKPGINGENQ